MALFIWTDVLATGSQQIDDDHRELVQHVNSVLEVIAGHAPNIPLGTALGELANFTREHFEREESAMRLSHYPELGAHAAEHAHLLSQLDSLTAQLKSDKSIDAMALYNLLTRWLIDHIMTFDKKVE